MLEPRNAAMKTAKRARMNSFLICHVEALSVRCLHEGLQPQARATFHKCRARRRKELRVWTPFLSHVCANHPPSLALQAHFIALDPRDCQLRKSHAIRSPRQFQIITRLGSSRPQASFDGVPRCRPTARLDRARGRGGARKCAGSHAQEV